MLTTTGGIITHRNVAAKQLNLYGLHLNKQGSTKLAGNIEYFKHCNLKLNETYWKSKFDCNST